MGRLVLVLAILAALAVVPASAGARAAGLVRVDGSGTADFAAQKKTQIFGSLDAGKVTYVGIGAPRVVACADARALATCARRKRTRSGWEWRVFQPARLFLGGRVFRLVVADSPRFDLGITGIGNLLVDGQGTLLLGTGETRSYDGTDSVQLVPPTRVRAPRV